MRWKMTISLMALFALLGVLMTSNLINTVASTNEPSKELRFGPASHSVFNTGLWAESFGLNFDETGKSAGPVETSDDHLANVAKQIPGFGGLFYGTYGTLQVYMKHQEQLQRMDQSQMAALQSVIGSEVFAGQDISQTGMEIIEGQYDFLQLKGWHDQMSPLVLGLPGVVSTDIDEVKNRLSVGVESLKRDRSAVEETLANLGIPREAVIIKKTAPIKLQLQKRHPILTGGLQIAFNDFLCTLGFITELRGARGFVTNSHCSGIQGGVQNTVFSQPSISGNTNVVGLEILDPDYFTGAGCPVGKRCRYSDSSFAILNSNLRASALGTIAATNGIGSNVWNGTSVFAITNKANAVAGQSVVKVGKTTGTTVGTVTGTCINAGVFGTDITQLCQTFANYGSVPGDSGSPVFIYTGGINATLVGIHWGGGDGDRAFSPITSVEAELGGGMTVCRGGGC